MAQVKIIAPFGGLGAALVPREVRPIDTRAALQSLARGVCLISRVRGSGVAVAVASASIFSVESPALLTSLDEAADVAEGLSPGDVVGVNVLNADQQPLAERRTARLDAEESARFALENDAPLLRDALAAMVCEIEEVIGRGGRKILIAAVRRVRFATSGAALVHFRGGFETLGWQADELSRAVGVTPKTRR